MHAAGVTQDGRYMDMFRAEAGFAVLPCTRYAGDQDHGLRVVATRPWSASDMVVAHHICRRKDERMRCLCGSIAELPPEAEAALLEPGTASEPCTPM